MPAIKAPIESTGDSASATDLAPRATDPSSGQCSGPDAQCPPRGVPSAIPLGCRPATGAKYADPRTGMPLPIGFFPAQPRDDDARWHLRLVGDEALLRPVVASLTGAYGVQRLYLASVYSQRRVTPEHALDAFEGARQLVVQCGQVLREAMLAAGFTESDFNDRAGDWLSLAYNAETMRGLRRATDPSSGQCSDPGAQCPPGGVPSAQLDASMPHSGGASMPPSTTEPRVSESLAASCDAGPAPASATS